MKKLLCVLAFVLTTSLSAQDAKPAPLTEVESLRVQNITLKRAVLERQLQDYNAEVTKLKADLEAPRPGWLWNADSGKWEKAPAAAK